MSEFKGTKGKWITFNNRVEQRGQFIDTVICRFEPRMSIECDYNALLISKAPEMLDFIKRISGEMLRNDFVLDPKWYEQAKQLIKEATEI